MEKREIAIVIGAVAMVMLIMGIISMVRSSVEAGIEEETIPATTSQLTMATTNYWDYYKQKHPETTEIPEPVVTGITSKTQESAAPDESIGQTDTTALPGEPGEETGVATEVHTETGMAEAGESTTEPAVQTQKPAYTLIVTTKG